MAVSFVFIKSFSKDFL